MTGRKPKPTALKKLQGNPGKRQLNKREPKAAAANIRVPHGRLPKDGQRMWRAIAPVLSRMGLLTELDLPALEMLCLHYAVALQAYGEIAEDGLTVETKDSSKKHPSASVLIENSRLFRAYLTDFGMNPSALSRLSLIPDEKELTLAEQLFQMVNNNGD